MKYWIVINNKQAGPYELEQLTGLPVLPNTPVWHEGLTQWIPAAQVPEIVALFRPAQKQTPIQEDSNENHHTENNDTVDNQQDTATDSDSTIVMEEKVDEKVDENENASATNTEYTYTQTQSAFQQQQPQQQPQNTDAECPPTYLGWAIASTVLCCIPFGVAAIIYSTKVKSKFNSGDVKGAEKASETAQWLIILAITLGIVLSPLQGILQLL